MSSKKPARATVRSVAVLAEVSPATVTRVLNQTDYPVTPAIKERVIQAANQLGYIPHPQKKRAKQECRTIGVVVPNISNPFYQEAVIGAQLELERSGFSVLLCNTFRRQEKEMEYLSALLKQGVPGVIYSASTRDPDVLREYVVKGMKFVLLDQLFYNEEICPHINTDNASGAQLAVEHLVENGHGRIAFASTPPTRWSRKILLDGFQGALARHRLECPSDYLLIDDGEAELAESFYEYRAGHNMAGQFIARGLDATAVVVVNDMMAMGFIRGLMGKGIRVPDDVSVVSFDNITFSEIFTPPLTTVDCPAQEIGRLAAQLLADQISNGATRPLSIKLQPRLIRRGTVKDLTARPSG